MAVVKPWLDDARLDARTYESIHGAQRGARPVFPLRHKSLKVKGRWVEVEREREREVSTRVCRKYAIRTFFSADCSVWPNSGLTNVGGPRCINGFAQAMALSPSRHTADMPFIDKWVRWIRRSCIELIAFQWNTYHAAIGGSDSRPGFGDSSMEAIACSTTAKTRQVLWSQG
ncbi:hypothetical protein BKA70DRAFT_1440663 [Coprinopsis sp. MPI-PUGE-AT-0042]|nr:hypothetical protein BKA70DRAFT_1440663 [Coprinopsis sp. MPI-PUGE-AT-0042]